MPRGRARTPSSATHPPPDPAPARRERRRSPSQPAAPARSPTGERARLFSGHSYRQRQVLERPDLCENGAGHGRNQGEQLQPRAAPGRQHRQPGPLLPSRLLRARRIPPGPAGHGDRGAAAPGGGRGATRAHGRGPGRAGRGDPDRRAVPRGRSRGPHTRRGAFAGVGPACRAPAAGRRPVAGAG